MLDVGVSEANEPYPVMEYLDGESLAAMLDRTGPISLPALASALFGHRRSMGFQILCPGVSLMWSNITCRGHASLQSLRDHLFFEACSKISWLAHFFLEGAGGWT
jgi:hypothetical protein